MKRTIPQKVRSVPACADDGSAAIVEQVKDSNQEGNRLTYGSVAMLGVALSVGTCGLLVPQKAHAATSQDPGKSEPVSTEPSAQTAPDLSLTAALPKSADITKVTHTVQEGQTLWKIAAQYGVDVKALASANGLRPSSTLYVGQVLEVPEVTQAVTKTQEVSSQSADVVLPNVEETASNRLLVASAATGADDASLMADSPVKLKQSEAFSKLQQKRDRLKSSLAELKSEESLKTLASSRLSDQQSVVVPSEQNFTNYQVNSGETLSTIAKTHGVSSRELAALNNLDNPDLLKANQVIRIPQAATGERLANLSEVKSLPEVKGLSANQSVASTKSVDSVKVASSQIPTVKAETSTAAVPKVVSSEAIALSTPNLNTLPNAKVLQPPTVDSLVTPEKPKGRYVENLVAEVAKLRQKYQQASTSTVTARSVQYKEPQRASAPVPTSLALNAPKPMAVNPEFKPGTRLDSLLSEVRSLGQQRVQQMQKVQTLPVAERPKRQVVARASVGSESYAPVVQASVRRMVSPDLPPIGTPDNYLPGKGSGKMTGYIWPAKGVFTSGYGWRWGRMHRGIDVAAPVGTPVVASANGVVSFSGWNDGGYGYLVEVTHPDGSMTRYAHNNRNLVRVGQQVAQGQQIAEMGSTGFSTGPHTHFEIHLPNGGTVNPIAYIGNASS
ncbi:peptidoglycan DD-metalloendopeptidase family protein [Alkalinema sp. FACHB-956]|uniref:peptidoglycan DD-metalloendopeptidase family protein n=1 Tax=Alkalinema sp. FACHB-956 TaxID=2692768 RepID=UPI001686E108|nr:peptidoglycan DD-metalloendopeptidase family protein [Alkalinema sp. FACHB-956]MBD2329490.1 peptidoglycan DD-metalloendopeptidase family protein [Alkalinema sp. FACHB-956]